MAVTTWLNHHLEHFARKEENLKSVAFTPLVISLRRTLFKERSFAKTVVFTTLVTPPSRTLSKERRNPPKTVAFTILAIPHTRTFFQERNIAKAVVFTTLALPPSRTFSKERRTLWRQWLSQLLAFHTHTQSIWKNCDESGSHNLCHSQISSTLWGKKKPCEVSGVHSTGHSTHTISLQKRNFVKKKGKKKLR